jgi:hypothetical protein
VFKDRACLIVERADAILTAVSLEHPIAAVTPANQWQQIRGPTHQDEHLELKSCFVG